MIYKNISSAKFISRQNRFIAYVDLDGGEEVCHVKNTGRCRELLIEGAEVFVQEADTSSRKTKYDLIGVVKGNRIINIDSQVPNKIFYEWLCRGNFIDNIKSIKPEARYKNSRFDFYVETEKERIFIEVKGVTLEDDNVVLFPDAPTQRGVKHIRELIECVEEGFRAFVVFVIQMKGVRCFMPNHKTHPEFAEALRLASCKGVGIIALDCNVEENFIEINERVEVKL